MRKDLRRVSSFLAVTLLSVAAGCVSIEAPERININRSPQPVDTRRVPPTSSHEEARQELAKAYQNIDYWQGKAEEYKRERDECRSGRDDD